MKKNKTVFYGVLVFVIGGLLLLGMTACNKEPIPPLTNINETQEESNYTSAETDELTNTFKTEIFKISSVTENGEGTVGGDIDEIQIMFEIPCEWKRITESSAVCTYEFDAKHLGFGIMRLTLSLNKITVSKEEHIKNWSDNAIPAVVTGKTAKGYDYILQNSLSAAYPTYYIFLTDDLILNIEYTDDYGFYNLSNPIIRRIIDSVQDCNSMPNIPEESKPSDVDINISTEVTYKTANFSTTKSNGWGDEGTDIEKIQVSFDIPDNWIKHTDISNKLVYKYDAQHLNKGEYSLHFHVEKINNSKEEYVDNLLKLKGFSKGNTEKGYDYVLQTLWSYSYRIFLEDDLILLVDFGNSAGDYIESKPIMERIINSIEVLQ